MKSINLKIFIITISLISLSAFSRDSLAEKSPLDSLKILLEDNIFGNEPIYDSKPILPEDQKEKINKYIDSLYFNKHISNDVIGRVVLRIICDEQGTPKDITVTLDIPKHMNLGEEAVNAMKLVEFIPATRNNKPVPAKTSYQINFIPPKKENTNCYILKAAYESKLLEWKKIETDLKALYEKYKTYNDSNIERYKPEYDSLFTLYNSRWEVVKSSNLKYLKCLDNNSENNNYYPPPPPPPPIKIANQDILGLEFSYAIKSRPEMTKESKINILNILDTQFSKDIDVSPVTIIARFICTKEGRIMNFSISQEKPQGTGLGEAVTEAMKYAEFLPAKDLNANSTNVWMSMRFKFDNKIENRIEIK